MSLRQKQSYFVIMVAELIVYAYSHGYELTFGDAYAHDGHIDDSYHYKRLAVDLNLFRYGQYLTKTEDHRKLGEYWEALGGTWGGRFSNPDGNHYSYGE
jgi:hypothetical protein